MNSLRSCGRQDRGFEPLTAWIISVSTVCAFFCVCVQLQALRWDDHPSKWSYRLSKGYIDISVDVQRASSTHQLTFNGLHLYISRLSKGYIDTSVAVHLHISWLSTGYIYTSVDFQRATSIHQLTFNGLHLYISWRSTGFIHTSVDFQRPTWPYISEDVILSRWWNDPDLHNYHETFH
jgi:hypothetical protein